MAKIEENICRIFYGLNENGSLEIEKEDYEFTPLAHDITATQAINIAKALTRKYDKVELYDGEYEAYLSVFNRNDEPTVYALYPEDDLVVAKKYGLYDEVEDDESTDLDKEKWDNYWGDFNQCGVRIDY